METMTCDCASGCKVVSYDCLEKANSKLCNFGIRKHPQLIDSVNFLELEGEDMKGLLGHCFADLCDAVKDAQAAADAYNCDMSTSDFRTHLDYLKGHWKKLVTNPVFKQMYAYYIEGYYYYHGLADAHTAALGDIKSGSGGNSVLGSNSYSHISTERADKRAAAAFRMAKRLEKKVRQFMLTCPELSGCFQKETTCKKPDDNWLSSEAI